MESTSYVLSFRMVFFYLVTTGWIFEISLCENSIKKNINQSGLDSRESSEQFMVSTAVYSHHTHPLLDHCGLEMGEGSSCSTE